MHLQNTLGSINKWPLKQVLWTRVLANRNLILINITYASRIVYCQFVRCHVLFTNSSISCTSSSLFTYWERENIMYCFSIVPYHVPQVLFLTHSEREREHMHNKTCLHISQKFQVPMVQNQYNKTEIVRMYNYNYIF